MPWNTSATLPRKLPTVIQQHDYGEVTCKICGDTVPKTTPNQYSTCGKEVCQRKWNSRVQKALRERRKQK